MKNLAVFIFLLASTAAAAQIPELSARAEISVITCGPGEEEVFLAFGHSAIRVYDPENRVDYAYNYGVFDFDQPNFYLNYTKGLLLFKLGVYHYQDFLNAYLENNRWVTEQVLNLSSSQKQAVFEYLERNALPENQSYRYDYFYNNCATKVRDVFEEVLGDSMRFDLSYIKTDFTIRDLTDFYLIHQPWGDLGIDICLGLPMDKKATKHEYMFIPDYVQSSFNNSFVKHGANWEPMVKANIPNYPAIPMVIPKTLVHPWVAMGGFLILTLFLSYRDFKRKKLSKWFDITVFSVTGLIGFLLLLLWTATDHQAAAKNFNLLWALPTNVFGFLILFKSAQPLMKKYFSGVTVITIMLLLSWAFLPQQLHVYLLPFVAALLVRSYLLSKLL